LLFINALRPDGRVGTGLDSQSAAMTRWGAISCVAIA
jgi:hypothetical protein